MVAGRQNKVGLDYFELDCHMDDKIKLIEAEFGLKGFAIIVKLYQSIYSGYGYYCEWTPDISLLWAMQLGISPSGGGKGFGIATGRVSLSDPKGRFGTAVDTSLSDYPDNLINKVIAASIRRDIFSKELFDRYRILTSSGIQKRYLNATSKREKVELKKEYLLIFVPKNRKNVVINSISGGINSISDTGNAQSRVEKSIEYPPISPTGFNSFWEAYPKKVRILKAEEAYRQILFDDNSLDEKDIERAACNYAEAVRIMGTEDRYILNPDNFLSKGVYADYLPGTYKRPQRTQRNKPLGQFNQFMQTDYDFEALERELLSNSGTTEGEQGENESKSLS